MKSYPAPPIPQSVVDQMHRLVASGASQELAIQKMRDAGLSIIPSIRLLQSLFNLSLGDAKQAVHFSPTWQDGLIANEALHDAAEAAAGQSDSEEAAGSKAIPAHA